MEIEFYVCRSKKYTLNLQTMRYATVRKGFAFAVFVSCSLFVLAEGTRVWEQSKFEEFVKGTPKGVALRSTGGLELAPAFKALATLPSTYIWSIASDVAGNIYAAAG